MNWSNQSQTVVTRSKTRGAILLDSPCRGVQPSPPPLFWPLGSKFTRSIQILVQVRGVGIKIITFLKSIMSSEMEQECSHSPSIFQPPITKCWKLCFTILVRIGLQWFVWITQPSKNRPPQKWREMNLVKNICSADI